MLLKNQGGLLPLKKTIKTLAVIGPNADNVEVLLGNYNGEPTAPVTPLAGLRSKLGARTKILYAQGGELADGLPVMETVPASALFTTDGADRQPRAARRSTSTRHPSTARCTALPGKTPARRGAECDAALHARGPRSQFHVVGRRAARRYG